MKLFASTTAKANAQEKVAAKHPQPGRLKQSAKTLALWVVLIMAFVAVYNITEEDSGVQDLPFSAFLDLAELETHPSVLMNVEVSSGSARFKWTEPDGTRRRSTGILTDDILGMLRRQYPSISVSHQPQSSWAWVLNLLPTLLVIVIFFFLLRSMNKGNKTTLDYRKAQYASEVHAHPVVDYVGLESQAEEIRTLIAYAKQGKEGGGAAPRACLLHGAPGTGKTELAHAVAVESGLPILSTDGAQFVEFFVGVGAGRMKDLFENARAKAPAIIIIDAVDGIARARGETPGIFSEEREQTFHQLGACLDRLNHGVFVIFITNRRDLLDPALLEGGRIDREIAFPLATPAVRETLLRRGLAEHASDVDLHALVQQLDGLSAGAIQSRILDAHIRAQTRQGKLQLSDFSRSS